MSSLPSFRFESQSGRDSSLPDLYFHAYDSTWSRQ